MNRTGILVTSVFHPSPCVEIDVARSLAVCAGLVWSTFESVRSEGDFAFPSLRISLIGGLCCAEHRRFDGLLNYPESKIFALRASI